MIFRGGASSHICLRLAYPLEVSLAIVTQQNGLVETYCFQMCVPYSGGKVQSKFFVAGNEACVIVARMLWKLSRCAAGAQLTNTGAWYKPCSLPF